MSASIIEVHCHPICPPITRCSPPANRLRRRLSTAIRCGAGMWSPSLVHYFDLLRLAAMGVS